MAGGVPVPEVIAWDADGEALGGAYIVTSRIEGETLPRRILRDAALEPARGRFAAECGTILAAIHAIDPDDVGSLPEYDPIEAIEAMLDASGDPRPVFELGLRWLRAHRPPAGRRAVVHGDFRNGNLIIGPEGVRAVLDWELAHIGDPLEDLGWLCVRAWRYGAAPLVGGMGTQRELLDAYARAGGPEVTEEVAFWWLLLGTVRWGVMCLEQARTHLSGGVALGRARRHRPTRRRGRVRRAADAAVSGLHGRPSAGELVEAVREFLREDVLGDPSGDHAFHLRVAINALGIVERELATGGSQETAHDERLAELGFGDDAELAAAIRVGTMEARTDLRPTLLADVEARLRVANPRYLDSYP